MKRISKYILKIFLIGCIIGYNQFNFSSNLYAKKIKLVKKQAGISAKSKKKISKEDEDDEDDDVKLQTDDLNTNLKNGRREEKKLKKSLADDILSNNAGKFFTNNSSTEKFLKFYLGGIFGTNFSAVTVNENSNGFTSKSPVLSIKAELIIKRWYGVDLEFGYSHNYYDVLEDEEMVPTVTNAMIRTDNLFGSLFFSYRYPMANIAHKLKFLRFAKKFLNDFVVAPVLGVQLNHPYTSQLDNLIFNELRDYKSNTESININLLIGFEWEYNYKRYSMFLQTFYVRGLTNTFTKTQSLIWEMSDNATHNIQINLGFKFFMFSI